MVKRQIVEGLTRENRQKRRQELGALKDLVIKPSTVDRYTKAFKRFVEYLKEQRQTLSSSKEGLDSQIQEYIEWLWEEGESISLAADTFRRPTFSTIHEATFAFILAILSHMD